MRPCAPPLNGRPRSERRRDDDGAGDGRHQIRSERSCTAHGCAAPRGPVTGRGAGAAHREPPSPGAARWNPLGRGDRRPEASLRELGYGMSAPHGLANRHFRVLLRPARGLFRQAAPGFRAKVDRLELQPRHDGRAAEVLPDQHRHEELSEPSAPTTTAAPAPMSSSRGLRSQDERPISG